MKKVMKKNGNEMMKNGKEVKKVTNKMIIGKLLMTAMKNDARFKGMNNVEDVIEKIESLRKNNDSHLSNFAYALFIAYKNGVNVFKKYAKNFNDALEADKNVFVERYVRKVRHYNSLIDMFNLVNGIVNMNKLSQSQRHDNHQIH